MDQKWKRAEDLALAGEALLADGMRGFLVLDTPGTKPGQVEDEACANGSEGG